MKTKKIISLLLAVMMIVAVIPAGIISVAAADTYKVPFTNDSWTTTGTGVEVVDGTTFTSTPNKGRIDQEYAAETGKYAVINKFSATTAQSYDLSNGFKLSLDLVLLATGGGQQSYGDTYTKHFEVDIAGKINFTIDTQNDRYHFNVNGTTKTDNMPSKESGSTHTPENAVDTNQTFTIEYKDGEVILCGNKKVITSGTLADGSVLSNASIKIATNENSIASMDVYNKATGRVNVVSNVSLDIVGEAQHFHSFTEYSYNNDAACEKNGTKTAECDDETCKETDTIEAPGTAGHKFVADKNGTTKTCSECSMTVGINEIYLDAGFWTVENDAPDKSTWSTTDGKTFTTKLYYSGWGDYGGGHMSNNSKATSIAKYDLSSGFRFTFTTNLAEEGYQQHGESSYVSFGDAIKFEIIPKESCYKLTVNGKSYTLDISEDEVAKCNTTFTIEYKDGAVTVSSVALGGVVTFGGGVSSVAVDSALLEEAQVVIYKAWVFHTVEKGEETVDAISIVKFETIPAPVAPVYEGVQEGTVDGVFSVRFVGTVKDLNYSEIGFEITAMDGAKDGAKYWTRTMSTNIVYSKLIGNTDTGVVEYTSKNLHGQYIYALTIKGVPKTGTVTFNVKTYGIVDGVKVEGTTYAVTYTNGEYVDPVVA